MADHQVVPDVVIPAQVRRRLEAAASDAAATITAGPAYLRLGVLIRGDEESTPAVYQCQRCVSLTADPEAHTAMGGCGRRA